ncbi:Protein of unknown function [Cotesia congregata]|uniref:Uncharacterized protein n=1 Tax=Cotesia congregata TaxID=51543 RepID=A0A8J2H760_COTCN|nr:Protein of unknown function [Cotesia congregata]
MVHTNITSELGINTTHPYTIDNLPTKHIECINNIILKMGRLDTEMEIQTLSTPRVPLHESIIADIMDIINYNHRKLFEISKKFSSYFAVSTIVAVIYFAASMIIELRYFILVLIELSHDFLHRNFEFTAHQIIDLDGSLLHSVK